MNAIKLSILLNSLSLSIAIASVQPLIIGGSKASVDQFPSLVSLRVLKNGAYQHDCGASIVSERFLVTAAHCKKAKLTPNDYRVSVGAHKRGDQGEVYTIKRFIVHPNYNEARIVNDIALVEMEQPIRLNGNVSVIELDRKFIEGNQSAVVAGWGRTEDGYTGLKYAEVTTMSNKECRKFSMPKAPITDFSTLCAYSGKKDVGICSGDSGGPLMSNNKLIGVSSWGVACAKGFPDGFARISVFAQWIDQIMRSS